MQFPPYPSLLKDLNPVIQRGLCEIWIELRLRRGFFLCSYRDFSTIMAAAGTITSAVVRTQSISSSLCFLVNTHPVVMGGFLQQPGSCDQWITLATVSHLSHWTMWPHDGPFHWFSGHSHLSLHPRISTAVSTLSFSAFQSNSLCETTRSSMTVSSCFVLNVFCRYSVISAVFIESVFRLNKNLFIADPLQVKSTGKQRKADLQWPGRKSFTV